MCRSNVRPQSQARSGAPCRAIEGETPNPRCAFDGLCSLSVFDSVSTSRFGRVRGGRFDLTSRLHDLGWRCSSMAASGTCVLSIQSSRGQTEATGSRSSHATPNVIAKLTSVSWRQAGRWFASGSMKAPTRPPSAFARCFRTPTARPPLPRCCRAPVGLRRQFGIGASASRIRLRFPCARASRRGRKPASLR